MFKIDPYEDVKDTTLAGYYVAFWNQGLEEIVSECILERNNDHTKMCLEMCFSSAVLIKCILKYQPWGTNKKTKIKLTTMSC